MLTTRSMTARDTQVVREAARGLRRADTQRRGAAETAAQKTERMGTVIAEAAIARGSVTRADLKHAGFTDHEIDANWNDALAYARTVDGGIDSAVAQQ